MNKKLLIILTIFAITFSCSTETDVLGKSKAEWIKNAFTALESGNYSRIKAISWWHENFDNSLLRVDSSPERFRDAYRHIIALFNAQGASNITRFFHVDAYSELDTEWNKIEYYYPGDSYIDWLGVSIYGPQERDEPWQEFSEILDDVYPRLCKLSDKPIAVLEFAVTEF